MGILHRVYARAAADVWETETKLLRAFALARRPVAVQWVVTSACDLHCPHCYSGAGRRTKHELATDEAKRLIVDELVALGRPLLVLAGGELLLRRDIAEIIEYARDAGLDYAIHTHGGHVPRFRALFERHPPVLAAISLDGDRELHDRFRGKDGSFAAAIDAMKLLRACGCPEIVAGTTITRESADRLVDLFPIVVASGATTWGLHLFAPEGRGSEHRELLPTPTQLRRVVEFARRRRSEFHVELCNEWGSAGALDTYVRDQPFACGAGRISCVVSPTGEVLPCTTTDHRDSEGNVRTAPLRRIWTEGFARFRGESDDPSVDPRQCWLQTRNDVWVGPDAFGLPRDPEPVPRERLAWRWIADRTSRARRIASPRVGAVVHAAAVGLAFVHGCVAKIDEPAKRTADDVQSTGTTTPRSTMTRSDLEAGIVAVATAPALAELPTDLLDGLAAHYGNRLGNATWRSLVAAMLGSERGDDVAKARTAAQSFDPVLGREPGAFDEVVDAHLERRIAKRPDTLADLMGLLNAAEQLPTYDPAFAAYIWRRARELTPASADADRFAIDRADLYARLHRHLRVADALVRAEAMTGPISFRPWVSKAMPPKDRPPGIPADLPDALRKAWREREDAGPWDRVGTDVVLRWAEGDPPPLLVSGRRVREPTRGASVRLHRLDLLRARAKVDIDGPGAFDLALAPGDELTLDRLGDRLPAAARGELDALVARATAGDGEAETRVETILPWAAASIRALLSREPGHPGAGKLKMWLVVVDE